VVPIASVAVMVNKRMMLMMIVKPTLVIMVISEEAARPDSDEQSGKDRSSDIFLDGIHGLK
jgi:hypothetical protein